MHFIPQVEKQTNHQVKTFQSDEGTEYKPLREHFEKKGIVHRLTCPYTSEQNGIIEKNTGA